MAAGSEPSNTYNGTFGEKRGRPTHTKLITVIFLFDWKVTECLVTRFDSWNFLEQFWISDHLWIALTLMSYFWLTTRTYFNLLPKQFTELPIFGVTIISTRHFTTASQEKNKNNNKKERIQICIQTFLHSNFASKNNALAKSLQSSSNLWLICFQQIIKFGNTC